MSRACDVAIIGAGPYGLSLAAHLRPLGLRVRIFGKPLDTWRSHMPRNMQLKSDGFASNLSAPAAGHTLKDYCTDRGLAYADKGPPIALDTFLAYAESFRKRFVPRLEDTQVTRLERTSDGFRLELERGEPVFARSAVMAVGITSFAYAPAVFAKLPPWLLSHSFQHRDGEPFTGREVAVIGAGASAIDTAALLDDCGAHVRIIARKPTIRFHAPPDPDAESVLRQLRRPSSGIGPGWRSFMCASAPLLFHRLPERLRLRATKNHLGPAPGWFMRERIDGRIPFLLGRSIVGADMRDGRVALRLVSSAGERETVVCDHVIAATGYKPDMRRLGFLTPDLLAHIASVEHTPVLSDNFETLVPGLFAVGPVAANSFGPLMRFMVGAEFAAPRLAAVLERRIVSQQTRRAA
jgi:thioredoxin reductase